MLHSGAGVDFMTVRDSEDIQATLAQVEIIRQGKGVSRHELADSLGIPFNTFRAWFNKSGRKPLSTNVDRLKRFIDEHTKHDERFEDLWHQVKRWWASQHRYRSVDELGREVGWDAHALRDCLEGDSEPPRLVIEAMAKLLHLATPAAALVNEARRQVRDVRILLVLLSDHLSWFRDVPAEIRDVYRAELDQFDVGYVASLMTMLFAEDKFERWREATTNRFGRFSGRGGV